MVVVGGLLGVVDWGVVQLGDCWCLRLGLLLGDCSPWWCPRGVVGQCVVGSCSGRWLLVVTQGCCWRCKEGV